MPLPTLPFKLSPAEADALIEVIDDYLEVVIADRISPSIEAAVDRIAARERLKARLCSGDAKAEAPRDRWTRPDRGERG
jgi:hypothetical protein